MPRCSSRLPSYPYETIAAIPTVARPMPISERRSGRSRRSRALSGTVQKVAEHCRKMALAAVVALTAAM